MSDVVVIGAGIIGLTSAVRLQERGLRVRVVSADDVLSTTSAVAAAVWYPTGMDESREVAHWSAVTFTELVRQAADRVPGVTMRPTRMYAYDRGPESLPWWGSVVPDLRRLGAAELRPAGPEPAGSGSGSGPAYRDGWEFTAPAVEMPHYLPWLLDRFLANGGELLHRRLDSLGEARAWAPTVVNASGLGARRLCDDEAVEPIRGQVVLVRNPGLHTSLRVQGDPAGYTYLHPRSTDIVLGGTYERGNWDTVSDPATARAILDRCAALAPGLRDAEVIGHRVGLRPARRSGVRLAADTRTLPGTLLVHAYGYGGAGVTLSWGCADAVAALATRPRPRPRPTD
ncbi:FAD-dependent oxidoreductase [Kitasatospora sp. NPDC056446]|uniref:FAD-dependent oxidoreductase n=1 Tax=Kitasatospora sp. NPDC056446 TaxID=3345819 RepID=UPI00368AFF65